MINADQVTIESLFHIGDYVIVDNRNTGWIIEKMGNDSDLFFKIQYEISATSESNVVLDRINIMNMSQTRDNIGVTTRNRMSSSNINSDNNSNRNSGSNIQIPQRTDTLTQFHSHLKNAFVFATYKLETNMGLYKFLKEGKANCKGWIRDIICEKEVDKKTRLNHKENIVLTVISALFSGYTARTGILHKHNGFIKHAFGVCHHSVNRSIAKFVASDYTMKRKERSDKGTSVFNCPKKRKARFTAYNSFKKRKLAEFRETTDRIPDIVIKNEFNSLPEETIRAHEILAKRDLNRSEHLWDELKQLLLFTKGKISYRCMKEQLGGIVSQNTIRKWLKSQKGFYLRKDRVLPSLDSAAKLRRLVWCHSFWLFGIQ